MKQKLIIRIISLVIIVIAIIVYELPNISKIFNNMKNTAEQEINKINMRDLNLLDFQDNENDIISIMVSDDIKTVYSYVSTSGSGIVRKKNNKTESIPTKRPFFTNHYLDKLRNLKKVNEANKKIHGLYVKDVFTNEKFFVEWNSELANSFCETIDDGKFNSYCEKYKNYTYPDYNYLVYSIARVGVHPKYELLLYSYKYTIYEDKLIYVTKDGNKKIVDDILTNELESIINEIISDGDITTEEDNLAIYDVTNKIYYKIKENSDLFKKLGMYLKNRMVYEASNDLIKTITIYKYNGDYTTDSKPRYTTEISANYSELLKYTCNNKDCKGIIEQGNGYFILEDEDYYLFEDDKIDEKNILNSLKKIENPTLYYYDTYYETTIKLQEQQDKELLFKYECKTAECIKNNYKKIYRPQNKSYLLIKDDAWYLYDKNTKELKTLQLDINKEYESTDYSEFARAYIIEEKNDNNEERICNTLIIDKDTLSVRKTIQTSCCNDVYEINNEGNKYILFANSASTTIYYEVYDENFNKLVSTTPDNSYRFTDYEKMDNGSLLLINYVTDEPNDNPESYQTYKIWNYVELTHKGELLNPQIYEHSVRMVEDIVFEYGDKTINVYDINHNKLASTEKIQTRRNHDIYSEPLYNCYENGKAEAFFGRKDSKYWTHYGNEGANAIKYTFNKDDKTITAEQTKCFVTEK